MLNKRTLAVVKLWEKLIIAKEFDYVDVIEIDEDLRSCFRLEEYDCVSEYLSELVKFVDLDRFVKVLTNDVCKKVGFPEFCSTSILVEDPWTKFPTRLDTPEGLRESYLLHPLRWMNALIEVRYKYVSVIPIGVFFSETGRVRPWYEPGKVIDFNKLSAKLIEMNPSDNDNRWKEFLCNIEDYGDGPENFLREKYRHEIEHYMKVPLRIILYEEKVFRDLENPKIVAPRKFKIVEMIPEIKFMVSYWLAGLECDTPILDALLNTGAFDLKI